MNNKQNAKYAFYYLLSLVALIFTAISVGLVVFSIIDKTMPDILNSYGGSIDSALKFAISALLIATPIFYLISALIIKGLRRGELDKESGIRRWLTYFILLVSSLIILGVFINVINNFLSGELSSRFILKALTVFILSALPFAFYFYDIKRPNPERADKVVKIFFWATLTLVLAAFIASWFFIESPQVTRARRLDQALINNIYSLESAVNSYYERYKKLPDNIDSLKNDPTVYLDVNTLVDPTTKEAIVYKKTGDRSFELCTTFRLDSMVDSNNTFPVSYPGSDNKNHRAGYQCLNGNLSVVGPVKSLN
ncbi:MAG: DUF5671 domain-containing protein [Patescibacteria group bacterium]|jgi:hypothetical protein